jgi:hypothetical protein
MFDLKMSSVSGIPVAAGDTLSLSRPLYAQKGIPAQPA